MNQQLKIESPLDAQTIEVRLAQSSSSTCVKREANPAKAVWHISKVGWGNDIDVSIEAALPRMLQNPETTLVRVCVHLSWQIFRADTNKKIEPENPPEQRGSPVYPGRTTTLWRRHFDSSGEFNTSIDGDRVVMKTTFQINWPESPIVIHFSARWVYYAPPFGKDDLVAQLGMGLHCREVPQGPKFSGRKLDITEAVSPDFEKPTLWPLGYLDLQTIIAKLVNMKLISASTKELNFREVLDSAQASQQALQGTHVTPEMQRIQAQIEKYLGDLKNLWGPFCHIKSAAAVWIDAEKKVPLETRIVDLLGKRTIRSVPIIQLLYRLANRNGISYPLAVVGGTVRDLLNGEEPNDIDIVVGGTYDELKQYLRDIFKSLDDPLSDQDLLNSTHGSIGRAFGQLKIRQFSGEKDPLDISLFKARRLGNNDEPFEFGWSYWGDSLSRDFCCNSMYIQLFPSILLIDPSGIGQQKNVAFPTVWKLCDDVSERNRLLKCDIGGLFRFCRAVIINHWSSPQYSYSLFNQLLVENIRALDSSNEESWIPFFSKMSSKFFKKEDPKPAELKWAASFGQENPYQREPNWVQESFIFANKIKARVLDPTCSAPVSVRFLVLLLLRHGPYV